jgi:putative FmdB family regulatory protein
MPLYEYQCEACGHRFEKIQKFSDAPERICPTCGGAVRKLMSSPAIQFKGSGFYITDYVKKDQRGESTGDAKPGDGAADKAGGSGTAGKPGEGGQAAESASGAARTSQTSEPPAKAGATAAAAVKPAKSE